MVGTVGWKDNRGPILGGLHHVYAALESAEDRLFRSRCAPLYPSTYFFTSATGIEPRGPRRAILHRTGGATEERIAEFNAELQPWLLALKGSNDTELAKISAELKARSDFHLAEFNKASDARLSASAARRE